MLALDSAPAELAADVAVQGQTKRAAQNDAQPMTFTRT
jgi:hypothetical protein